MERAAMQLELLDGPLDDPAALRGNLRDLSRTNRLLGGTRLSAQAIDALIGGVDEASIIDVGTGAADIPRSILERARGRGRTLRVTAIDSRAEVLEAARAISPSLARTPGLTLEVADGAALPYPDSAFDVGHASLVIHHLEPTHAVAFLDELARVAGRGIVVNDLIRSRLTYWGAWLGSRLLTTNRYTRNDAPLSVRRAYTRAELVSLIGAAGLRVVGEFGGLARHRRSFAAVRA